jgi:hypothetical protein
MGSSLTSGPKSGVNLDNVRGPEWFEVDCDRRVGAINQLPLLAVRMSAASSLLKRGASS